MHAESLKVDNVDEAFSQVLLFSLCRWNIMSSFLCSKKLLHIYAGEALKVPLTQKLFVYTTIRLH
jgi:hypothetical protein